MEQGRADRGQGQGQASFATLVEAALAEPEQTPRAGDLETNRSEAASGLSRSSSAWPRTNAELADAWRGITSQGGGNAGFPEWIGADAERALLASRGAEVATAEERAVEAAGMHVRQEVTKLLSNVKQQANEFAAYVEEAYHVQAKDLAYMDASPLSKLAPDWSDPHFALNGSPARDQENEAEPPAVAPPAPAFAAGKEEAKREEGAKLDASRMDASRRSSRASWLDQSFAKHLEGMQEHIVRHIDQKLEAFCVAHEDRTRRLTHQLASLSSHRSSTSGRGEPDFWPENDTSLLSDEEAASFVRLPPDQFNEAGRVVAMASTSNSLMGSRKAVSEQSHKESTTSATSPPSRHESADAELRLQEATPVDTTNEASLFLGAQSVLHVDLRRLGERVRHLESILGAMLVAKGPGRSQVDEMCQVAQDIKLSEVMPVQDCIQELSWQVKSLNSVVTTPSRAPSRDPPSGTGSAAHSKEPQRTSARLRGTVPSRFFGRPCGTPGRDRDDRQNRLSQSAPAQRAPLAEVQKQVSSVAAEEQKEQKLNEQKASWMAPFPSKEQKEQKEQKSPEKQQNSPEKQLQQQQQQQEEQQEQVSPVKHAPTLCESRRNADGILTTSASLALLREGEPKHQLSATVSASQLPGLPRTLAAPPRGEAPARGRPVPYAQAPSLPMGAPSALRPEAATSQASHVPPATSPMASHVPPAASPTASHVPPAACAAPQPPAPAAAPGAPAAAKPLTPLTLSSAHAPLQPTAAVLQSPIPGRRQTLSVVPDPQTQSPPPNGGRQTVMLSPAMLKLPVGHLPGLPGAGPAGQWLQGQQRVVPQRLLSASPPQKPPAPHGSPQPPAARTCSPLSSSVAGSGATATVTALQRACPPAPGATRATVGRPLGAAPRSVLAQPGSLAGRGEPFAGGGGSAGAAAKGGGSGPPKTPIMTSIGQWVKAAEGSPK